MRVVINEPVESVEGWHHNYEINGKCYIGPARTVESCVRHYAAFVDSLKDSLVEIVNTENYFKEQWYLKGIDTVCEAGAVCTHPSEQILPKGFNR